jgi:voltage-gated potassium channel Kch
VVVGVLAVLVVVGRFLLRPAFRLVASIRSQDLSTASALLVVIGTASAVHAVGLSMPLGAFLAGVLLADSEYRHELEADIEPFKGLLLGLFFVAVGMSANLRLLASEPLVVVGLTLALVGLKAGVLFGIGRFTNLSNRNAASLAIAASQGGEFAFVIFADSMKAGVLGPHIGDLLVVVVTLSLVTTPLLFVLRDAVFKRLGDGEEKRDYDAMQDDHSRVIIAGFGRVGQIVGRILLSRGIPFTALDASAQHVDFVRNFGNRVYYGDASRLDLLKSAKADKAEVFVLAIDDFEASMRTLKIVKENFPNLHVVARARNRQHAFALLGEGVTQVVRENFFGSVEMSRLTLEELGFTSLAARRTASTFAEYDEAQVRKMYPLRNDTKALIASAKSYAKDLEEILKQDEREAI